MSALARLTPRERLLVLGGGAALAVLALWLYAWQPLLAETRVQQDRIARYLALIEIAQGAADAGGTVPASPPADLPPLGPRVTASAEAAGIALARLDPDGARLRLTVAEADYTALTDWIATLEATRNVRAVSVEMDRLTQPGRVSMRLTLEDAP